MEVIKYSEKILVWLHRESKPMSWLADKLNQTRQSISQKIKENSFQPYDKIVITNLGFKE